MSESINNKLAEHRDWLRRRARMDAICDRVALFAVVFFWAFVDIGLPLIHHFVDGK